MHADHPAFTFFYLFTFPLPPSLSWLISVNCHPSKHDLSVCFSFLLLYQTPFAQIYSMYLSYVNLFIHFIFLIVRVRRILYLRIKDSDLNRRALNKTFYRNFLYFYLVLENLLFQNTTYLLS